jgi:hypothetical protein
LSRGENELKDPELNNRIDELLAGLKAGHFESATIAGHMQDLYIAMQEENDVGEYKYKTKNVFKKLASTVGLQEDTTLYRMCVAIAEDIDQTDSKQELPYHNKQHFTEAMVSCLVLGKVERLDNDTIGKLLFTALIHDFRYPKKGELPAEYQGPSKIEKYSCNEAGDLLKAKEFKEEEIGEPLNFARALVATTDIFSSESKALVVAVETHTPENNALGVFIDSLKDDNDFVKESNAFVKESAEYFLDHLEDREAMKTMLEADIFSSCILEKLFEIKTEELLLRELEPRLNRLEMWEKYLTFLDKNAVPYFGEGHFFSREFNSIKGNAERKLEELRRERPAESKLEEERVRGFLFPFLFFLASASFCFISVMIFLNYFNFVY